MILEVDDILVHNAPETEIKIVALVAVEVAFWTTVNNVLSKFELIS